MVAQPSSTITTITWRARRPWVRRRLHAALVAGGRAWRTIPELVEAAELEDLPPGEAEAAVTDLVQVGAAEGVRAPHGWSRVRGLAIVVPECSPTEPLTERIPHPAVSPEMTGRRFSVINRIPRHRSSGLGSGAVLFAVAALAAGVVAFWLVRSWTATSAEQQRPLTRAGWYQQTARSYIDGYLARRPGFALPYRFTEVSGVPGDGSRSRLEEGMERYIQVSLFLGSPSLGGILAWARGEFGELPSGPQAMSWFRRVAETYAARSLAGTTGYEVTPALAAAGGITVGERDPAVLTDGLVRALQAAVFLGTPDPGGVLDWARRSYGDLPAR